MEENTNRMVMPIMPCLSPILPSSLTELLPPDLLKSLIVSQGLTNLPSHPIRTQTFDPPVTASQSPGITKVVPRLTVSSCLKWEKQVKERSMCQAVPLMPRTIRWLQLMQSKKLVGEFIVRSDLIYKRTSGKLQGNGFIVFWVEIAENSFSAHQRNR